MITVSIGRKKKIQWNWMTRIDVQSGTEIKAARENLLFKMEANEWDVATVTRPDAQRRTTRIKHSENTKPRASKLHSITQSAKETEARLGFHLWLMPSQSLVTISTNPTTFELLFCFRFILFLCSYYYLLQEFLLFIDMCPCGFEFVDFGFDSAINSQ